MFGPLGRLGYAWRMIKRVLQLGVFFIALGLVVTASARNVYRWVDADGTVNFSDRPLDKSAEIYEPTVLPPKPVTGQGDPEAERRKRKCIEARELLEQYNSQSEIRRVDPDTGRIVRIEADAREDLIREARQDALVWCDPEQ